MRLCEARGCWALVTGASSGIGREFARGLAAAGLNVVLVARRLARLEALARELENSAGVRALPLAADLSDPATPAEIRLRLQIEGIRVRLLCNNAAVRRWAPFENSPADFYDRMIRINAAATVALTLAFLPDLASFPSSVVINVASPAALQPVPFMAVYAATKSFVMRFSQALHAECRDRGVLVQTLLPGPTETGLEGADALGGRRNSPAAAVRASLAHLAGGAPVVASARGVFVQSAQRPHGRKGGSMNFGSRPA